MLYTFPSQFVYWEKLPEHNDIKDDLLSFINDDVDMNGESYRARAKEYWGRELTTSFFKNTPLRFMNQTLFNTIVWGPFQRMYDEVGETLPKAEQNGVAEFWYNQYNIGEQQEVHSHINGSNAVFSGIYLLELDEENPTTFINPHHPIAYKSGATHSFDTKHLKEGSVILFPACLLHYVMPAQSKRTTISFNIYTN